jgi:hypothetical protein
VCSAPPSGHHSTCMHSFREPPLPPPTVRDTFYPHFPSFWALHFSLLDVHVTCCCDHCCCASKNPPTIIYPLLTLYTLFLLYSSFHLLSTFLHQTTPQTLTPHLRIICISYIDIRSYIRRFHVHKEGTRRSLWT